MNTLLVTGGCGFIGTNFIRHSFIKHPGCKIINLDKLTYAGNRANLSEFEGNRNYEFVQGDICDKRLVDFLMRNIDAVVHFAAETHVDRSNMKQQKELFERTNVDGTHVLLEAALKYEKRFHHISTDEVFGSLDEDEPRFNEKSIRRPTSIYSKTKNNSDWLTNHFFESFKLPVTISNCSNNYGPFQFPEKFIPLFITNLLEGKKVPLYGDGRNIRDWLNVQDHVEAIDLILRKGKLGETYCIGGDCELRNTDIAKIILELLGKGEEMIEYVKDRPGHDWRYAIDSSKIQNELGWKPKIKLERGLAETVTWYMQNEKWWEPLKKRVIQNITELK